MKLLQSGAATDVGRVRDHNEDNLVSRPDLGLWVVADGMGGHEAGEVASGIAVEVIPQAVEQGASLEEAIQAAHEEILRAGQDGRGASGMGCTVVALHTDGVRYRIAWVGDSRGYLANGATLRQLTRDHSYVQQLVDSGVISAEEARFHPQSSVISQALGVGGPSGIRIEVVEGTWQAGDRVMLCSDGLTGEVPDEQIAGIMAGNTDPEQAVKVLIGTAVANGGSDNVTVICVEAPDGAVNGASAGETRKMRSVTASMRSLDDNDKGIVDARWLYGKDRGQNRRLPLLLVGVVIVLALLVFVFWPKEKPSPAGGGGSAGIRVLPTEPQQSETRGTGAVNEALAPAPQVPTAQVEPGKSEDPIGDVIEQRAALYEDRPVTAPAVEAKRVLPQLPAAPTTVESLPRKGAEREAPAVPEGLAKELTRAAAEQEKAPSPPPRVMGVVRSEKGQVTPPLPPVQAEGK